MPRSAHRLRRSLTRPPRLRPLPADVADAVAAWVEPLTEIQAILAGVDLGDFEAVTATLSSIPPNDAAKAAQADVESWATENCGWSNEFDRFADAPEPPDCDVLDPAVVVEFAGIEGDIADSDGQGDISLPGYWQKSCSYGNGALTLSTISFNDLDVGAGPRGDDPVLGVDVWRHRPGRGRGRRASNLRHVADRGPAAPQHAADDRGLGAAGDNWRLAVTAGFPRRPDIRPDSRDGHWSTLYDASDEAPAEERPPTACVAGNAMEVIGPPAGAIHLCWSNAPMDRKTQWCRPARDCVGQEHRRQHRQSRAPAATDCSPRVGRCAGGVLATTRRRS